MASPLSGGPAQEEIAGGLHEMAPHHNSLAMIGVGTLARIGFEHRGAGLFDLKKQRVLLAEHKLYPTVVRWIVSGDLRLTAAAYAWSEPAQAPTQAFWHPESAPV